MTETERTALLNQINTELDTARLHKQGKVPNWKKNESMYYGQKQPGDDSRANVDLGRMQEFVHTLLSKIDDPLVFEYKKRKLSQERRVARINAVRDYDRDRDNWDIKDIVGKKQAIIYGRAVYHYTASSLQGYQPHLDNVDVYDFQIDPNVGGIEIENAFFLGRYGVIKTRQELEKVAKSREKSKYDKQAIKDLLAGGSNRTDNTREELDKRNRRYANQQQRVYEHYDDDVFVFWEWYTTFNGKRYYVLYNEQSNKAIRVCPLTDLFSSNLWPFWSFASFPDLTEFWTPSYCDYVREIFLAQNVSINQMLDNAEQINKPGKLINASAIPDKAQLKYKRGGNVVEVAGNVPINQAVQMIETPSIDTPLKVYDALEGIQDRVSGVTAAASGVSDTQGRSTIYEGNMQNVADRFGLFNKSYKFGHKRFGKLYEYGIREHMTRKTAIEVLGPDGLDIEMISKFDIFRKNDEFALMVISTNAEVAQSEQKKRAQAAYLSSLMNNPQVNQKEVIQQLGLITGVDQDTIRRLLEVNDFGEAELISEASRDIEDLMDGKQVFPNRRANAAYKQYIVNFLDDHFPGRPNGITTEEWDRIAQYVAQLDQIIVGNTIRQAQEMGRQGLEAGVQNPEQQAQGGAMIQPGPAQPMQDVINQNVNV
jgi:hypothetical protein